MTPLSTAARLRIVVLFGTVVSVNAAYTVLIPFVPELQQRMGANELVVGLAFTLFAAGKLLAQPIGGVWVDRQGPRGVAFVALLLVAAGTVGTALADGPALLLLGRAVWGIGEGVLTPALYAGLTHLCHRYDLSTARMMGLFGSSAIAGFLIGPLITGLAAGVGFQTLFLFGAATTVLSALAIVWGLPGKANQVNPVVEPEQESAGELSDGPRWWVWVLMFGSLDLVTNLTYSALEPVLPLYLAPGNSSAGRSAISFVFASGLAVFGVTAWLIGRVGDRLSLVRLAQLGLVFSLVGVVGLAVDNRLSLVTGCFVLIMVGQSMLYLAARRGVIEVRTSLSGHGRAFGLFGATSDVGNVIGPTLGVALYGWTTQVAFLVLAAPSAVLLLALGTLSAWRAAVGRRQADISPEVVLIESDRR